MTNPRIDVSEGRAIAARPSLRLLLLLVATAFVLLPVLAAQAETKTPVLTFTDPKSPSTDLFPLVHGNSTGVDTSAIRVLRSGAMMTAGSGPNATIDLFGSANCEGPTIGTGTAQQLDTSGIQVSVGSETTTVISARQTDDEGTSGCSNAIAYEHVKELPPTEEPPATPPPTPPVQPNDPIGPTPSPPRLRTIPGGWANDNTPLVTGSAPGASSVRIYADPRCQGSPVAKGSAGELAAGIPVRVVDNDVTVFSGKSVAGDKSSSCSDPVLYVEDSLTPHTRITMGPAAKTAKRRAIFRFMDTTGNAPGTTFLCKVDTRRWKRCTSPLRLRKLRPKRYTVRVKAIDPAGNAETRGAKRRFKVVAHP